MNLGMTTIGSVVGCGGSSLSEIDNKENYCNYSNTARTAFRPSFFSVNDGFSNASPTKQQNQFMSPPPKQQPNTHQSPPSIFQPQVQQQPNQYQNNHQLASTNYQIYSGQNTMSIPSPQTAAAGTNGPLMISHLQTSNQREKHKTQKIIQTHEQFNAFVSKMNEQKIREYEMKQKEIQQ